MSELRVDEMTVESATQYRSFHYLDGTWLLVGTRSLSARYEIRLGYLFLRGYINLLRERDHGHNATTKLSNLLVNRIMISHTSKWNTTLQTKLCNLIFHNKINS